MFKLILITAFLLGIGFAGIALKIWAKKDGEFDGTCSSRNASGKGCACGGGGACENDSTHIHNTDRDAAYFDGPPRIIVKKVS
jgi:hypothetical protein